MNKAEEIKKINRELEKLPGELADIRREGKYFAVPGDGSLDASIMLIGEAPGANEAKTGKPFVGSAGKFLNQLLTSVEISRDEIFITSIVKDRPPKNRDPKPDEIALYTPLLDRQIEIIKPRIIATLGRFAMEYVMNKYGLSKELKSIGELHGHVFDLPDIKILPLYHPAASIYNQKLKPVLIEDFKILKTLI